MRSRSMRSHTISMLLAGLLMTGVSNGGAFAQDQPVPVPAPAAMSDADRAAAFSAWATTLAGGDKAAAMTVLTDLLANPQQAAVHGEAWARLGEMYEDAGYELAALGAMGKGLLLDPVHAASVAARALALVERISEAGLVGEALGKNVGISVDEATRNTLAVVAAKNQLDQRSYGPALAILAMTSPSGPRAEDVSLLKGITLAQQDRHQDAVVPMLTALAQGVAAKRDARWLANAHLNLARTYYAVGDYGNAIAYYAKIERTDDVWLDSHFERAWAHFRGNDANGALAMLHTHDAPFFDDFYYPEADLLRAYGLFVMCKFPSATQEIDAFGKKYEPMSEALKAATLTPEAAFADAVAFRADKDTALPGFVLRSYRTDTRMTDAIATLERAEDELKRIDKKLTGAVAATAKDLVTTQRNNRVTVEGTRILGRVSRASAELSVMLEGLELTRLDLLNLETQLYERAAATGVYDYGAHVGKLKEMRKARKGFRVWPWQGEYWADELGWYVFNARPDCPESLARGNE